jgi:hypothetical protein
VKIIPALSGANILVVDFRRHRTGAQSLPKSELKQVVPNSKIVRLGWMTKAPVDSGRLFAVSQVGKILVVKKFGWRRRKGIFQLRRSPSLFSK